MTHLSALFWNRNQPRCVPIMPASSPPEPLAADPDVIHMVIRVPNGERLERRFRGSHKLEVCIGSGWERGLGGQINWRCVLGGGLGGQISWTYVLEGVGEEFRWSGDMYWKGLGRRFRCQVYIGRGCCFLPFVLIVFVWFCTHLFLDCTSVQTILCAADNNWVRGK